MIALSISLRLSYVLEYFFRTYDEKFGEHHFVFKKVSGLGLEENFEKIFHTSLTFPPSAEESLAFMNTPYLPPIVVTKQASKRREQYRRR